MNERKNFICVWKHLVGGEHSTNKGNLIYLNLRYGSAVNFYYHSISILQKTYSEIW